MAGYLRPIPSVPQRTDPLGPGLGALFSSLSDSLARNRQNQAMAAQKAAYEAWQDEMLNKKIAAQKEMPGIKGQAAVETYESETPDAIKRIQAHTSSRSGGAAMDMLSKKIKLLQGNMDKVLSRKAAYDKSIDGFIAKSKDPAGYEANYWNNHAEDRQMALQYHEHFPELQKQLLGMQNMPTYKTSSSTQTRTPAPVQGQPAGLPPLPSGGGAAPAGLPPLPPGGESAPTGLPPLPGAMGPKLTPPPILEEEQGEENFG